MMTKILYYFITLFLLLAKADPPPNNFDKAKFAPLMVRLAAIPLESIIKLSGLKVYSCQVIGLEKKYTYDSLATCLTEAAQYTFDTKESAYFKLWLLNEKGEYLSPLLIKWKLSHRNWGKVVSEVIDLAIDRFFNKTSFDHKICKINQESFLKEDRGNLIGELEISTTGSWTLKDYFQSSYLSNFPVTDGADSLKIRIAHPEINKRRRIYEARLGIITEVKPSKDGGSLFINLRTNYNPLISPDTLSNKLRENLQHSENPKNVIPCLQGNFEYSVYPSSDTEMNWGISP